MVRARVRDILLTPRLAWLVCRLTRKAEEEDESDRIPTEDDGMLVRQNGASYETESSIDEPHELVQPRWEIATVTPQEPNEVPQIAIDY